MKKKAVIISFYESNNIGDLMISGTLSKILSKIYEIIEIDFSTTCPPKNSSIITVSQKSVYSRTKKIISSYFPWLFSFFSVTKMLYFNSYDILQDSIKSCDTVFLAGGNMFMKTYTYKANHIIKICKRMGKNVNVVFVGIGPLQNLSQRNITRKAINQCSYVSVRDNYSKKLLDELSVNKKVFIWRDPAFLMNWQIPHKEKSCIIGINIFFGTDEKRKNIIKNAYVDIIERLCEELPGYALSLFSTEMSDYRQVELVFNDVFSHKNVSVVRINDMAELFDFYRSVKIVLGARMHAMITAFTQRIPVVALSWQKKHESLFEFLDFNDSLFRMNQIENNIENIVQQILSKLNCYQENVLSLNVKMKIVKQSIEDDLNNFLESDRCNHEL